MNEETRPNDEGTPRQDEKSDENKENKDELEHAHYDDSFEMEQPSSDEEEKRSYEGEEWDVGEEELSERDWEREAKKKIRIEMHDPAMRRRKTIYDLESYASYATPDSSMGNILRYNIIKYNMKEPTPRVRYSVSMGMWGIARIDLSPLTQKIVGCVIGENVTTEYPWVYVRKEIIEDNIDLHSESSDFLPMKDEIHAFPEDKMLIGYAPSLTEDAQFYICLTQESKDAVARLIQEQREEHENRVRVAVFKPVGRWYDWGSGAEVDAEVVKYTRPLFEIEVTSTADLLGLPINLADRRAGDQRDGYIELLSYRQIFDNVWRKLVNRSTQVAPFVRHNEAQTASQISSNSWFQYLYEYETIDLSTYPEEKIDSLKDFLYRYTDDMCDQVIVVISRMIRTIGNRQTLSTKPNIIINCNYILMNSTWDIYTNDYANLVSNEKDTQAPMPIGYTEHQSYYEGKLTVSRVVNDLCWHPFWTGVAMVAYTRRAKSEHLIGPKSQEEVDQSSWQTRCLVLITHDSGNDNRVLIWSFNDFLSPKLILESPREVTSVSVCPLDGSVVVGGCTNGQVAIWHIPGKIEEMETVVTRTSAQEKYTLAMKSLMTWMRDVTVTSRVAPTAMSSLLYSQKAAITQITWMPSYYKMDRSGRIASLPEDASLDDLSWQFVTASEDGTIAFWDLKYIPPSIVFLVHSRYCEHTSCRSGPNSRVMFERDLSQRQLVTTGKVRAIVSLETEIEANINPILTENDALRKKRWRPTEKGVRQIRGKRKRKWHMRTTARPTSPFKILDRVFQPNHILELQYPDERRRLVITTLSMYNPKFHVEQVEPFPVGRDDVAIRKYYRPIIEKADYIMEPKMLVGTVEGRRRLGDFGCITWEGFEFATDVSVSRETARWQWMKRTHDGPVTHSVRSRYYHKLVVTVGGKIFAVWRDDFGEPLLWKKSNIGYTACSWGILRPTVLILARMDGTVEIWDLVVKSHEPSFTQSLSGRIICGVYTHDLPLESQCVGFCDFTGALRIFTAPRVLMTYDVGDVEWIIKFVDRQVQRISEFKAWQRVWRETNPGEIEMRRRLAAGDTADERKRLKPEEKTRAGAVEETIRTVTPTTTSARRRPWQFLEKAKSRWMSMEEKRMQRVILEKKGLRKDVIERQRAPILKLRQEASTKKHKIREILRLQDKIFEETVAFLFPEQQQKQQLQRRETLLLPPLPVSATDRRLTIDEFIKKETALRKEEAFADPQEEIIYNFLEVQAEALAKLKSAPFERTFDWRQVLAQAKSTRRLMNVELKKLNKLRGMCRVLDGSAVNDASRMFADDTMADVRESW
ncbi:WD repeat-containing protein 63 [Harpegnathos saltator]|uniref:WD repeat-containing protein 63 n=1 Tax=Harpegnathos saltator TaxID=610380 RepID=UPI000DBED6EF|nr:WD repeat-containing protein 63 [Harpegnathos saltator]